MIYKQREKLCLEENTNSIAGQKNLNSMNKPEQHKVEFCWKHENTDCHGKKTFTV